MQTYPVLLNKINPPKISGRALQRPRITAALMETLDFLHTVMHAGAGYGKSTMVHDQRVMCAIAT